MRGKEHVSVINREITFQGRLMVLFCPRVNTDPIILLGLRPGMKRFFCNPVIVSIFRTTVIL